MDEPQSDSSTAAELAELREQVRSLRGIVKLVLVSAFIATGGLSLFLYRQSSLLKKQLDAQQVALRASQAKEREVVLKGLDLFRRYGGQDPVYASNVLTRFELSPLAPTNPPMQGDPKR